MIDRLIYDRPGHPSAKSHKNLKLDLIYPPLAVINSCWQNAFQDESVEGNDKMPIENPESEHPHAAATRLSFLSAPEKDQGILDLPKTGTLDICVSRKSLERALKIMSLHITAWEEKGWEVFIGEKPEFRTRVVVDGEELGVRLEEIIKCLGSTQRRSRPDERMPNSPYPGYVTEFHYEQSGVLQLLIEPVYGARSKWKDGLRYKMETCVEPFIRGLQTAARKNRELRFEQECWRRQYEEEKRLEREKKARIESFNEGIQQWETYCRKRDYLLAARDLHLQNIDSDEPDPEFQEWFNWNMAYAEKFNPLGEGRVFTLYKEPSSSES